MVQTMKRYAASVQQPDRKVTVGAGMGGLSALLVYTANAVGGIDVTPEAAIGLSTFLTFVTQYFVPNPSN